MERGHQHTSLEVLSDFCDGSHFRSHSMFATHSKALQILLYYDDIEMCNPLGSHTKKHKLGNNLCVINVLHPHPVCIFVWELCSVDLSYCLYASYIMQYCCL